MPKRFSNTNENGGELYRPPESPCYFIDVRNLILNATHELSNDLTAIALACELVTRTSASANDVLSCMSDIQESTCRAQEYCRKLSRLACKVSYSPKEVNLTQKVEDIFSRLKTKTEERKLNIEIRSSHVCCHTDAALLDRALENIVLTTVSTTPFGGTISISLKHWHKKACIEIINDGTRTRAETLNYLVDPLSQSSENRCAERLLLAESIAILKLIHGTIRTRNIPKAEPVAQILLVSFPHI